MVEARFSTPTLPPRNSRMQLKTILNRVHRQPGFVYGHAEFGSEGERTVLNVEVRCRRRSRGRCSGCLKKRPGYDTLAPRRFAFVPLWGILVYLVYAMRRVDCPKCGVVVEAVPWAHGKERMTTAYMSLFAGHREQGSSRCPRPGPLSRGGQHEQGNRPGARSRSAQAQARQKRVCLSTGS